MKLVKKWIVTILVFWGLWRILFYLLSKVLFEVLIFPEPYANVIQMVGIGITLLVTLILTSLLVKDRSSR
jgi:hypothetical protein